MESELRPVLEEIILDMQTKTMKAEAEFKIAVGASKFYVSQKTYKGMLWQRYKELYDNYKKLYDQTVKDGQ